MQENKQEKSLIKQNILAYLKKKGVTPYECYKKTGITRGVLTQNNGITEENILKFLAYYSDVDVTWLITGRDNLHTASETDRDYHAVEKIQVVEEPYHCPRCIEKEKEINDLRENINDLRKHIALLELGLGKSLKSECG